MFIKKAFCKRPSKLAAALILALILLFTACDLTKQDVVSTGQLIVTFSPDDAKVDVKLLEATPKQQSLQTAAEPQQKGVSLHYLKQPGDYEITVSKAGYKTETRKVTLHASEVLTVNVDLVKEGSPTPGPTENKPPNAAISVNTDKGQAPLEVQFDANSSTDPDGRIVKYEWDFDDGGANATGVTAEHTYKKDGVYQPQLTVTDDKGATNQITATITVGDATPTPSGKGSIRGVVYGDKNADKVQSSGEKGLKAITVFLDENNNGVLDPNESSVQTDQEGRYEFKDLDTSKTYTVTQQLPFGWTNTSPGRRNSARYLQPNIIGGSDASLQDFPFMAALVNKADKNNETAQGCGASLIAGEWVLTAAHCVVLGEATPENLEVLISTDNLSRGDGQRLAIKAIHAHEGFETTFHDIALIQLAQPVLVPRVGLVTPELKQLEKPGTLATVIGWGVSQEEPQVIKPQLQKVEVPIISNAKCSQAAGEDFPDYMVCAGEETGGEDSCFGDSGGPLLVRDEDGDWKQSGIVSFGFGEQCAQKGTYGVYARVSALTDFIFAHATPETSGSHTINWSQGTAAEANFGNFK